MTVYNVLRWSVFSTGIVYGFLHNRTLASNAEKEKEIKAYKKHEKLIAAAKEEWNKLHPKPEPKDGPVLDLASPDFDPVKAIDWKIKQLDA